MVNPHDEVTLGEIGRRLDALSSEMRSRFDSLEYVPRGEHNIQIQDLKDSVRELEDWKKWIARTLVAAFLFPLLVAAVVAMVVTR